MFLDRLRLGKSVHASIRSIPYPQSSSWASEMTLFWPSASASSSPEASFVYISAAETHYLRCSCVVFACHAGLVMRFQLRTSCHSRPSYWAGWRRLMTKKTFTHRVVCFAVAKELFSSPLVGKWPLFASTRSQAHCGISIIKQGLTQPGSEIKTGSVMARWKVLPVHRHSARTSLDGEWMTWSSQLKFIRSHARHAKTTTTAQVTQCSGSCTISLQLKTIRNKRASALDGALDEAQNEVWGRGRHLRVRNGWYRNVNTLV